MKKIIFILVLIIIIAVIVYYRWPGKIIRATFNCASGKTIRVEFSNDKVKLLLSDGRKIELTHAISASGARYANSDESFVFWNKGNTAFIEENGQMTFTDCLEVVIK